MTQARPYYADKALSAAFYDTVTAADARLLGDINIYAGLIRPSAPVLELGVGTGRIAFALADLGHSVTGVEIAPTMLAQALAKWADLKPEVQRRLNLHRGDMTSLDLKQTFDLVVCGYFTLAHVPRGAAWRNTFETAARHLAPGGLAAFHLPRVDIMRLPGPSDLGLPVLDQPAPTGGRLLLYIRERTFREEIGRLDQVIEYVELDARGKALRRSLERLTYYWTDPDLPAQAAGFMPQRDPIPLGGVGDIHVFRKI
jgi:SAM-dependent methyltransferase